jgi:hypothetical protein
MSILTLRSLSGNIDMTMLHESQTGTAHEGCMFLLLKNCISYGWNGLAATAATAQITMTGYTRREADMEMYNIGVLYQFWPPIVRVSPLTTPFGLLIPFITIPVARNYNHSQLFLTRLRVYTIIILTRSWLHSHITLLHVYTVYKHYTLIFTALLHIKSPNWLTTSSLADFSAIGHFHRLSHTFHLHTSRVCLLSRPHS